MKIFQSILIASAVLIFTLDASKADTFQPTRLDDPTPDGCQMGDCSLREAVIAANSTLGDDEIILDSGNYILSIPIDVMNESMTGDLDVVSESLLITGAGHWQTTINAQFIDRVFDVENAHLTLHSLKVVNGLLNNGESGAGVRADGGSLTLEQVEISDNFSSQKGGAIWASGSNNPMSLVIADSVVKNNTSMLETDSGSGVVECSECTVNIVNSSFELNNSDSSMLYFSQSVGVIDSSVIKQNTTLFATLDVRASLNFNLINSTISGNINTRTDVFSTIQYAGNSSGTFKGNTIVDETKNWFGGMIVESVTFSENIIDLGLVDFNMNNQSAGFNVFVSDGLNFAVESDALLPDSNALALLPLYDNGGIGYSHELGENSIARDFNTGDCSNSDQRGLSRNNPQCDVGSYQSGYCSNNLLSIPDNDPLGVVSQIVVEDVEDILNLELFVDIEHSNVGDMEIELTHDNSGIVTLLINQPQSGSCSGNDMNLIISETDLQSPELQNSCESSIHAFPQLLQKFRPLVGGLDDFVGANIEGVWSLKIIDHSPSNSGSLNRWCLYPKLNFVDLIFASDFE